MSTFESKFQTFFATHDTVGRIFSGGIAGIVAKSAIAPLERIKMSFQVSNQSYTSMGAINRGKDIYATSGIMGLWKGHTTTIIRVAPYAGLSYAIHDFAEREFKYLYKTDTLPFALKFLSGSIGGMGATLLTYPLDVLRVRLALIPGSTWASTIRQGGLYNGLTATLIGIIPYNGTGWSVKQTLLEMFPEINSKNKAPDIPGLLLINGVAGIFAQFVTYPLDIVRRRLQMNIMTSPDKTELNTISGVFKDLVNKEGRWGLTKGFSLNLIKGPITVSLSFTTYDILSRWIKKELNITPHLRYNAEEPRQPADTQNSKNEK